MTMTLPAVAKSVFTSCKKCEADRYHRVLAHTTSTSAKVECEICKSKKTFTLPKATSAAKRAKDPSKKAAAPRRSTHASEYSYLMTNRGSEAGVPFNIRTKFEIDQKIDHPKFGAGFVKNAMVDRIEVIFEEELKTLMHNKV